MNIVVCIKQVPVTENVKMNSTTNTIVRDGIESVINPFDLYAVEEALRIKEKKGGKVIALSMGIPSADLVLKQALAMGCDEAILLTDKRFAGADTLATAYTLSKAIMKLGTINLIICGKQAIDGDTAQVGPSLAAKLGYTHMTCVQKINSVTDDILECERMLDDGYEEIELKLPTLITVIKDINKPRIPTLKSIINLKKKQVIHWNVEDILAEEKLCGLKGSPTQVVSTFNCVHNSNVEILEGDITTIVRKLFHKIQFT